MGLQAMVDPPGSARLWIPRLSLAQCIKCVMMRNTAYLPDGIQLQTTWLPASPCCALTWFLQGRVEQLGLRQAPGTVLGRYDGVTWSGPQRQPTAFRYPGPTHGFMLLLMPDAFTALTGLDASRWLDQTVPADDILAAIPWLARLSEQVRTAVDDEHRVQLIESELDQRWQAVRPEGSLAGHLFDDWAQGLTLRAANTGVGRSMRQFERRIKSWTGQPLRELRGLGRSERAFFQGIMADESGQLSWADVAEEVGYADQSHMCRQTRRLTGFAPRELRQRILADEGFWAYRLWGFSEVRPLR